MSEIAVTMPGHISHKGYIAEDGERPDGRVMCFFRCFPCALEYPVAVEAAEVLRAGLSLIDVARDPI